MKSVQGVIIIRNNVLYDWPFSFPHHIETLKGCINSLLEHRMLTSLLSVSSPDKSCDEWDRLFDLGTCDARHRHYFPSLDMVAPAYPSAAYRFPGLGT